MGVGAVLVGGAVAVDVVVVSSGENKICIIDFVLLHQRMLLV